MQIFKTIFVQDAIRLKDGLISSLLMLSFGYCDQVNQIDQVKISFNKAFWVEDFISDSKTKWSHKAVAAVDKQSLTLHTTNAKSLWSKATNSLCNK